MHRDEIAEKYYDTAIRIAKRIAESEGMLESDLTGPAFEGLLRGADALAANPEGGSNPESFIKSSIRNSIIDFVRKERKYGFTNVAEEDTILPLISLQEPISRDSEQVIEDTITAEHTDIDDFRRDIREIIDRLPADYRKIFYLKFKDPNITEQEIADEMGLSISTIKQRIYKARKIFRN
jgi:RNA polymerase sigma factor (sigma-70 family)